MSNDKEILKFLFRTIIHNEHPALYQYIKGRKGSRSRENAVRRITEEIYEWCNDMWMGGHVFDISYVRGVARSYLEYKEYQHLIGEINIKGIHQT